MNDYLLGRLSDKANRQHEALARGAALLKLAQQAKADVQESDRCGVGSPMRDQAVVALQFGEQESLVVIVGPDDAADEVGLDELLDGHRPSLPDDPAALLDPLLRAADLGCDHRV